MLQDFYHENQKWPITDFISSIQHISTFILDINPETSLVAKNQHAIILSTKPAPYTQQKRKVTIKEIIWT